MTSELDRLMKALASGDRSAFTPVFRALWEPVLKLSQKLVGDDAPDVAQTAMLHVLERAHEYDPRRPALPWALGIAAWECKTQRKKYERRRETGVEAAPESDGGSAAADQEQRLLISAAMDAMGTLSEADQQTLIETYWDIASPVSGATLRKRRERALTRLRDAFRRLYGFD